MARIDSLTNFLTDVASAIRTKKGTQMNINASQFDTEILNLPSSGTYQQKTVNIYQNGNIIVTPDQGYDAIDELTINTAVPGGTVSGVKQFSSVSEMNNSVGNIEGDLAIVYGDLSRNINELDIFNSVIFPNVVVLPNAVSSTISARFSPMNFDSFAEFSGTIGSSSASFTYGSWVTEFNTVTYTSSDGITYTRTDFIGNPVELSDRFSVDPNYTFNPIIGYFVQVGSIVFDGLYKYTNNLWQFAPSQLNASSGYVFDRIYYGSDGVKVGTLQSVTGLNKGEVEFRRNIRNLYSNMSVSDASLFFSNNRSLTSFDPMTTVSDLVFENLTDTHEMFNTCTNLTNVSNMDTSNVTNMYKMFYGCGNLTSIPDFDTSNVTDLAYFLSSCRNLTTIPNFNTSKVTNMSSMLSGCYNITPIPNFDTSQVTDMYGLFSSCRTITDVLNLNTSKVTNMAHMFYGAYNITNISNFNTVNVTNMSNMFYSCNHLTSIPLFDTSNVVNTFGMFNGCINLIDVPQFDTNKVTTIRYMFTQCNNLSNSTIQNIVNMCLNSNLASATYKNLRNTNTYSPLFNTKYNSSYYSNRLSELNAAGWKY